MEIQNPQSVSLLVCCFFSITLLATISFQTFKTLKYLETGDLNWGNNLLHLLQAYQNSRKAVIGMKFPVPL